MEREEESKAATHEEQVLQYLASPHVGWRLVQFIIVRLVFLVKGGHLRFGCASEWRCVDNNGIWFWCRLYWLWRRLQLLELRAQHASTSDSVVVVCSDACEGRALGRLGGSERVEGVKFVVVHFARRPSRSRAARSPSLRSHATSAFLRHVRLLPKSLGNKPLANKNG